MRRTLLRTSAALVAAALFAACSHDLSLQVPTGPVVQALTPTSAFSGQVLRIRGTGFDLDPTSNLVVFPGAQARAHALSGGDLLVRVPANAGSGTVSVTNSLGSSAPVSGFTYRGRGELRDLRVVQQTPLLHAPRRLFSIAGRLLADSILVAGIIDVDDPSFFVVGGGRQIPSVGGGAVYAMDMDYLNGTLRRADATTGAVLASRAVGIYTVDTVAYVSGKLLATGPSPTSDRLAMWTLDPISLDTTAGPFDTTAWFGFAIPPRDLGDGRAAFAVMLDPTYGRSLRVGLADVTGAGPTYEDLGDGGHVFDYDTIAFAVGQGPRTQFGAGATGPLAAVGLSSGDVAIVDLTSKQFETAEIKTYSPDPVHSVLFVPELVGTVRTVRAQLIATKPSADVVIGIDLATREVAWSVSTTRPTRMTLHSDGLVYVASDADDRLVVIDPAKQAAVSARSIDVGPGTVDGYGGLAFAGRTADASVSMFLTDAVYFPIARPHRALRYALGDLRPIVAQTQYPPEFLLATPDYSMILANTQGIEVADAVGGSVFAATPAAPIRIATSGNQILVGTNDGFSLVESQTGGTLAEYDGPYFPFDSLAAVGFTQAGSPWAIGSFWDGQAESWVLAGWPMADIRSGTGIPHGVYLDGPATGLQLDQGLWVFQNQGPLSLRGTAYLVPTTWVGTTDTFSTNVVIAPVVTNGIPSPNGRTFVHWRTKVSPDGRETADLYVRSCDDATGFVQLGYFSLDGPVAGVTFDDTGERLFVVTRSPDQLLVIQ
jgi:hypothetical protein